MRERKLIHPRKVVWAMRDFINEIHNITYETVSLAPGFDFTHEDWLQHIETHNLRATCKIVKGFDGHGFCAILGDLGYEEFRICYDIEELYCKGSKQFTDNFRSRSSIAKGFADITLSLLHELGHFETYEEIEGYDRRAELQRLDNDFPVETINFEYFKLPDETAATEWAIKWLQEAKNRKIAKAFEKKFFACFAK